MAVSYFLGANSHKGFASLYEEFCKGPGDYLHIIKGGPGTGKSSFMNNIALAAEEQGFAVERLICSGDPDSLDGIYLPALQTGWLDGTAPHVREVHRFGLDSDYVNLGQFCSTPLEKTDRFYVGHLYSCYQRQYAQAYQALYAAEGAAQTLYAPPLPEQALESARHIIDDIWARRCESGALSVDTPTPSLPHVSRCFMRGITCQGEYLCEETLRTLCEESYLLPFSQGDVSLLLAYVRTLADQEKHPVLHCCDPRNPDRTEGLLIPALSLGFFGTAYRKAVSTSFPLLAAGKIQRPEKDSLKAERHFLQKAVEHLDNAKKLHDELEGFYIAAMDFDALNAYTQSVIHRLFP